MARSRIQYIQQVATIILLSTNESASFIPSSSKTRNNNEVMCSFSSRCVLSMKDDNYDEVRTPISNSGNETKVSDQSVSNIQALQQEYEMLIAQDPLNSRGAGSGQKSSDPQDSFEASCTIPSELISILKQDSLWTNTSYLVHVPAILTSTERKRRLLEIDLLQNLIYNDDETVHQLWSLWYTERDHCSKGNATAQLYAATTYSNDPNTWDIAEQILRQLILQHGIYWVEPLNRLATLYYLQGKYQQSIDLCNVILYVKPWHFGALSGMVGLYIQLNDTAMAKKWSEQRLPSYVPDRIQGSQNSNQRRVEWVRKAVSDARLSYEKAEQQLQLSFGSEDMRDPMFDVNTTSWQ